MKSDKVSETNKSTSIQSQYEITSKNIKSHLYLFYPILKKKKKKMKKRKKKEEEGEERQAEK